MGYTYHWAACKCLKLLSFLSFLYFCYFNLGISMVLLVEEDENREDPGCVGGCCGVGYRLIRGDDF